MRAMLLFLPALAVHAVTIKHMPIRSLDSELQEAKQSLDNRVQAAKLGEDLMNVWDDVRVQVQHYTDDNTSNAGDVPEKWFSQEIFRITMSRFRQLLKPHVKATKSTRLVALINTKWHDLHCEIYTVELEASKLKFPAGGYEIYGLSRMVERYALYNILWHSLNSTHDSVRSTSQATLYNEAIGQYVSNSIEPESSWQFPFQETIRQYEDTKIKITTETGFRIFIQECIMKMYIINHYLYIVLEHSPYVESQEQSTRYELLESILQETSQLNTAIKAKVLVCKILRFGNGQSLCFAFDGCDTLLADLRAIFRRAADISWRSMHPDSSITAEASMFFPNIFEECLEKEEYAKEHLAKAARLKNDLMEIWDNIRVKVSPYCHASAVSRGDTFKENYYRHEFQSTVDKISVLLRPHLKAITTDVSDNLIEAWDILETAVKETDDPSSFWAFESEVKYASLAMIDSVDNIGR